MCRNLEGMPSGNNTQENSYQDGGYKENLTPQLIDGQSEIVKVYKIRWYILALYCLNGMFQNMVWNTWGPVQVTARAVYHWEDYVIDLMAAWGSITYCITMLPFAWLMDVKGNVCEAASNSMMNTQYRKYLLLNMSPCHETDYAW